MHVACALGSRVCILLILVVWWPCLMFVLVVWWYASCQYLRYDCMHLMPGRHASSLCLGQQGMHPVCIQGKRICSLLVHRARGHAPLLVLVVWRHSSCWHLGEGGMHLTCKEGLRLSTLTVLVAGGHASCLYLWYGGMHLASACGMIACILCHGGKHVACALGSRAYIQTYIDMTI